MELRNYQQETYNVLLRMEKGGNFSTLVNLPTGSGKTAIGVEYGKHVLKDENARVLWLADRNKLLEQAEGNFKEEYESRIQKICGETSSTNLDEEGECKFDRNAKIVFANIRSLVKVYKSENKSFRDWLGESQKENGRLCIIYDEAHHIGENQAQCLFTSLLCDKSVFLEDVKAFYTIKKFAFVGMTATVYRGDKFLDVFKGWFKDGYDKQEDKLLHNDSAYGDYLDCDIESLDEIRVSVVDIEDLIKGYKGDKPHLIEPDIIKVEELKDYKMIPNIDDSDNTIDLEMEYLAKRLKQNYEDGGKTAVIVNDTDYADALRKELEVLGIEPFLCTSKQKKTGKILKSFKEAKGNAILIAVHIFDEGVDVPDLNTIYLYAPTNSQILIRQRIGRVVRKNKGKKKKARVIWQYYDKNAKKTFDNKAVQSVLKKSCSYVPETEQKLQEDFSNWMKDTSSQLPAIMYRKPITLDKSIGFSAWMLLRAEALFGTKILGEGESIGYFYDAETFADTDDAIFVRRAEREGYLQYLRVLQNDWFSLLRYQAERTSFEQYADALGVSEEALLADIKCVCFYMEDAQHSDTLGKKVSKRLFVNDGEIKTFFHWFMAGKIQYEVLSTESKSRNKENYQNVDVFKELEKEPVQKTLKYNATQKQLNNLKNELTTPNPHRAGDEQHSQKEYTDLLTYCEGKYNYYELQSMKSLMRMGATDILPRIKDSSGQDALMQKEDLAKKKAVLRKCRTTLSKEKWLLIASALVEIPNHIQATQDDVNDYEHELKRKIPSMNVGTLSPEQQDQLVKEYLLALGYAENKEIIQRQCQLFDVDLPMILQYVLYGEIYKSLVEKLSFCDKNGVIHPTCQNVSELDAECRSVLKEYHVKEGAFTLKPVEDVIYDYRPYLKAVPYYQGIKPEFLCRMANDLLQLSTKKLEMVIDGFGGSGACTMNGFFNTGKADRVYNDLGIMNTSFYRCIQNDMAGFVQKIQSIIEDAFTEHERNYTIPYLKEKYGKFVKQYLEECKENAKGIENELRKQQELKVIERKEQIIEASIESCEKEYKKHYKKKVENYQKDNPDWQTKYSFKAVWLENRLLSLHKNVSATDVSANYVERYFHVFMQKLNIIYQAMTEEFVIENVKDNGITEVDLAVLFFFYNTLSHRHFYNGCTIKNIQELVRDYRMWLGYAKECFCKVKVEQKDALILLKYKRYNVPTTSWYLDIPYAETSSADYVAQWFDNNKFIECLSGLNGNYIVSSRCNICLPDAEKKAFREVSTDDYTEEEIIGKQSATNESAKKDSSEDKLIRKGTIPQRFVKELNVFSFFSSFTSETDEIQNFVETMKVGEKRKPIKTTHIAEGKEATYILIPYTKMSEIFVEEADKDKDKKETKDTKKTKDAEKTKDNKPDLVENSSVISEDYVRRMLAATHYSNIPVDIMVTNIDIDLSKPSIRPTYNAEGEKSEDVYVMPTFRTGVDASQYMTEPAVIVMKYTKFMEILASLLYHKEWKTYKNNKVMEESREDALNIFRGMFGAK